MYGLHTAGATKEFETPHTCIAKDGACDDRLLVAEAKSANASAFGALYERHRSRIYHAAFRILRNQQDAEDAVQRSFQRAFVSLARFREDSSFSTWMTRIAINEALMLLRQKRSSKILFESDNDRTDANSFFDLADKQPTPEQALAKAELRNAVIQAISKLRHSSRVVVLLEVHGFTSAETARRLGLTVSAVKARALHARRHLRRDLERNLGKSCWLPESNVDPHRHTVECGAAGAALFTREGADDPGRPGFFRENKPPRWGRGRGRPQAEQKP